MPYAQVITVLAAMWLHDIGLWIRWSVAGYVNGSTTKNAVELESKAMAACRGMGLVARRVCGGARSHQGLLSVLNGDPVWRPVRGSGPRVVQPDPARRCCPADVAGCRRAMPESSRRNGDAGR